MHIDLALQDTLKRNAEAGDYLSIHTIKPFLSKDVYEFTTFGQRTEAALAKEQMDRITVVPNPYIVSNTWEPLNPYVNGRGTRELHFIHLPERCTISIYNIRGQLVRELEHVGSATDGTEIWDMLSKDQLEISYGVYFYHIDAGEIGMKNGKFAIIK